jgi:hypothetical protein
MLLDLQPSPHSAVYDLLKTTLRADPTLAAVCRTFLAWDGKPTDATPLTTGMAPAVRIYPRAGPDSWEFPAALKNDLFVDVELLVQGYDVRDLLNLWWAFKRAIYPAGQGQQNVVAFQQAGALSGLWDFTMQPMPQDHPESSVQYAVGQMRITIREQLLT